MLAATRDVVVADVLFGAREIRYMELENIVSQHHDKSLQHTHYKPHPQTKYQGPRQACPSPAARSGF